MLSMRFIRRFFVLVLLVISAVFVIKMPVNAQDESSLQVSPAILDVSGNLNKVVKTSVTLSNLSNEPLAVTADVRSLTPEDQVIDSAAVNKYDATKWMNLPVKDFLIEPKKSVIVEIDIKIPSDAVPGGHYALTVFRIINTTQPDGSGVTVTPEAGVIMLITVSGEIREKAELHTVENKKITFGGNAKVAYELMNTGNSHITPVIRTEFRDRDGTTLDSVTQPVQLLLPNTKRKIELAWGGGKLGRYTAHTTVSYGTPTQVLEAEQSTFIKIQPIQVLIINGILVMGFLRLIKNKWRIWANRLNQKKPNISKSNLSKIKTKK